VNAGRNDRVPCRHGEREIAKKVEIRIERERGTNKKIGTRIERDREKDIVRTREYKYPGSQLQNHKSLLLHKRFTH
jgi:hypothetical protein